MAREIEELPLNSAIFSTHKPFKRAEELRETLPWKWFGSFPILVAIPWAFTILFMVLFHASLYK